MAIFHLSVKNVTRSHGRSAIAAAAYRAGVALRSNADGRVSDFSNRGGVVHSEVVLPEAAPHWMKDREALWNAVEAAEARKDARLAKEVEIALPIELDRETNIGLARAFVFDVFARKGFVADLAVHEDEHNPHAHILLVTRSLAPDGFGPKDRRLDDRQFLAYVRESWERHANDTLAQKGVAARIDRRSLEAQGIDRVPQQHRGPLWNNEDNDGAGEAPVHPPVRPLRTPVVTSDDQAENQSEGEGEAVAPTAVERLDRAERELSAYLTKTKVVRERAGRRAQAMQEFQNQQHRVSRQHQYLDVLRTQHRSLQEQKDRAVSALFRSFATIYHQPDHAYFNLEKLLFGRDRKHMPSLFNRRRPSLFGKVRGWSFLGFDSPKRRQAKNAASLAPQYLTDWLRHEARIADIETRFHAVRREAEIARDRLFKLHSAIRNEPPIELDLQADRDTRVRLYQERNALLAVLSPEEIAHSPLPDDRKTALLAIARQHHQQKELERAVDRGGR